MATYLMTWHPKPGDDDKYKFSKRAASLRRKRRALPDDWSCGKRKHMLPGEPFFFLRQGPEPRGIFGFGHVAGTPWEGVHWEDSRKRAQYGDILIEDLVDPAIEPFLDARDLKRQIPEGNWEPFSSGQCLAPEAATKLTKLWRQFRAGKRLVLAAAVDDQAAYEGELKRRYVIHRRREAALRQAKLLEFRESHGGRLFCEVPGCYFDFGRRYGDVATEYAQVHHLTPLASRNGKRRSPTRLKDLAVVCANCHAVIHLGGQCRTLQEVGQLIADAV
jgi:hypothetical protein